MLTVYRAGTKNCTRLPASSVLLFDVVADPSETTDLSASMPQVVRRLKARLELYNATVMAPFYPDNDPAADPKKHGGVWTPWR